MTFHYNKSSEKKKRRELRHDATPAEKILWQYLRAKQIGGFKFRRQYSINSFIIIDFYCAEVRLAIEVDGDSHLTGEAAEYDHDRQKNIEAFGVSFLRFKNEDVSNNVENVIDEISAKARELKQKRE